LKDNKNRSAISFAEQSGQVHLFPILTTDPQLLTLPESVVQNRTDQFIALVKQGINVNQQVKDAKYETALIAAAATNNIKIVEMLLEHSKINLDMTDKAGKTALYHAASKGHQEIVLLLLKAGCNRDIVASDGRSATDIALKNSHPLIASIILADPKRISLIEVCAQGKEQSARGLLMQNVPVNIEDLSQPPEKRTPLIAASNAGHFGIVKLLVSVPGIQIDKPDETGKTPLMYAVSVGALDVAHELIQAGANPDAVDYRGNSVIAWSRKAGNWNMIRYFGSKLFL